MRLRLEIVLVALIFLLTAGMVASAPSTAKVYTTTFNVAAASNHYTTFIKREQVEEEVWARLRARQAERAATLLAEVQTGIDRRAAEKAAAAKAAVKKAVTPRVTVTESTSASVAAPAPSGSVEGAIATYFGDVYTKAYNVAFCESRHDPSAISPGGGNWGLFQINVVHKGRVANMGYSWNQLLDPYVNAHVARSIYDEQGWGPWSCRGA